MQTHRMSADSVAVRTIQRGHGEQGSGGGRAAACGQGSLH